MFEKTNPPNKTVEGNLFKEKLRGMIKVTGCEKQFVRNLKIKAEIVALSGLQAGRKV